MWTRILALVAIHCIFAADCSSTASGAYWIPSEVWGQCDPGCGPGIQQKLFVCAENDRYNATVIKPEGLCGPLPEITGPDMTTECNWGDCQRNTWWRASNWSLCTQPCGNRGFTRREVECIMKGDDGDIVISQNLENNFCDPRRRPESEGFCNRFNCPAEFHALEWQKCEQKVPCKSGFQKRQLACRSLTASGTDVELPNIACFMGRKPPPAIWRRCFIPEISAMCTQNPPVIEEVKKVEVQMRAVRKMRLQVGQVAYILPGTRLSIRCPVKFFISANIIWRHKDLGSFSYTGDVRSTSNQRIVSKSGQLVIRHFTALEAGQWRCYAGNTSAAIDLHYNLPSKGFADWSTRNAKRNTDMQNEDPAVIMTRQRLVQWVDGPWSNCSVPCGGKGIQTREVRCELLDTGVYHVLEDSECEQQFLVKPHVQRTCVNLPKCPTWKLQDVDYTHCTDNCVAVGRGTFDGILACVVGGSEIPVHNCDQTTKPDITCENPNCQAKWAVSSWSKCSVSCGGEGYQYREHKCVWAHTDRPAGSACYEARIEAPSAVQTCIVKPCRTICVDLSDQCPQYRHWCEFKTYKYNCCKTCQNYAQEKFQTLGE